MLDAGKVDRAELESDRKEIDALFQYLTFPNDVQDFRPLSKGERKLVHYTSAESAVKILNSKTFLMRNTRDTNDATEIDYGAKIFIKAWNDNSGEYSEILNGIESHASETFVSIMTNQLLDANNDTYISCFSEHELKNLELTDFGFLSMWRAYGVPNGVCLILNIDAWLGENMDHLSAPLFKINYNADSFFNNQMKIFFEIIKRNSSLIKKDPVYSIGLMAHKFKCDILSTKHPIFKEEREWRSIYSPKRYSSHVIKSKLIKKSIPELSYVIPLEKRDIKQSYDLSIGNFIEKIVIGPSKNPPMLRATFVHLLDQCGVTNPENRVHIADVPLRV